MKPAALAAALLFAAVCNAQVFSVGAPKAALLYGESMTLTPVLRDSNGNQMTVTDWVWTSLNPDVLTVDQSGNVTGKGLGTGTIKLQSATQALGLFGQLALEVQPGALSITPLTATLAVGGSVRFAAAAADINGAPIPNPLFSWLVTGEDGRSDQVPATTRIDSSGNFTSTDAGFYTVHAVIDYQPVVQGLPSHFEIAAPVTVYVPASYAIDRLVSSDPVPAKKLQPAPGVFVASDSGAMAFTASADGLSTTVLQLNGGPPQSIVASGSPSPQAGSVIAGFQSIAMNSLGQMLISIQRGDSANGALLASTPQGSQYVLLDNANGQKADGTPLQQMSYFYLTPYSLNDGGAAVIRALYLPAGAAPGAFRNGIFLLPNALTNQVSPILLWPDQQGLPGVPGSGSGITFPFDDTEQVPGWAGFKGLGIDNNQIVYFMAQSGGQRGLFQTSLADAVSLPPKTPQKLVALGDGFLGGTVKDIQDLIVSRNGDVTARVDLTNGDPHVVLFRLGKYVADLLVKNGNPRVLAESAAGVLFTGVPGPGKPDGLYMWDFKTQTTVLSLGPAVTRISTAAIAATGKVTAVVQNAASPFSVVQPAGAAVAQTLISSGGSISLSAPIDLKRVVKGSGTGLPSMAVSSPGSDFDLDGQGNALPRVVLGQSLAAGVVFAGAENFVEDGAGAHYFVTSNGLYKSAGASTTLLVASGTKASDGVLLTPRLALGVNAAGLVALDCFTNAPDGHRRLYTVQGSNLTLIARTNSSLGAHTLVDWSEAGVDGNGNVAVIALEEDSAQEVVEWSAGAARELFSTRTGDIVSGEQVVEIDTLRGSTNWFYVRLALTQNFLHATVVKFTAGSIAPVATSGDPLPDGTYLGDLRVTDGNARGDVVFTSTVPVTGTQVLAVRLASGSTRIVAASNRPLPNGDYIERFSDTNIRDDGTVYFLAFDVNDRALVYRAAFIDGGPAIAPGGAVNAADFRADTIAPGSWFAVYGQNLGRAAVWTDVNTTSLGGAAVTLCAVPAALSFNSGPIVSGANIVWQLNALAPDSIAGKTSCPLVVAVDGKVSSVATVAIKPASLGIFSFPGATGDTLPLVTHADYSLVGPAVDGLRPARPGEVVLIWGTGTCANPSVTVAGQPAAVQFAGRVAPGVCQINAAVPQGPSGSAVLQVSSSAAQYTLWVGN